MNTLRILFIGMLLAASHFTPSQAAAAESGADLKSTSKEYERWCFLGDAAIASLDRGRDAEAKSYAEELERLAPKYPKDWNYGNAIQDFNIVLGRLALKAGDVASARAHLLAAGRSPGSPQMDSFGPDLSLAKELIAKNERAVVLEYLELCRKFWKDKEVLLDHWKKEIEQNRVPNFSESTGEIVDPGRSPAGKAEGSGPELVMKAGMKITAQTKTGAITITAGQGLHRTYTWEGASRSCNLTARPERWYGSLGAYDPAGGEPWADNHGVTRGVVEEGQQHFASEKEAMDWLREQAGYYPTVYRDDGLVVSFGKVLPRRQINVDVWQIFIHGAKPEKLPGSDNQKIEVIDAKAP